MPGLHTRLPHRARRLVDQRLLGALDNARRHGEQLRHHGLHLVAGDRLDIDLHLFGFGQQRRVGERRHERLAQCRHALGRHAFRQHERTADHRLAVDQFHHLAVFRCLRKVDGARHALLVELRRAFGVLLHDDAHELVGDPLRSHRQQAGVAEAAKPVRLAALDRERHLPRAGITGDDTEFRAKHVVRQCWHVARGAAFIAGADDHLLRECILERLDRRVGAHHAGIDVAVGAADIDEFRRIVLDRRVGEERCQDAAGKQQGDGGAVPGRDRVHVAGRLVAARARHVLHHDRRVAGNVFAHVAAERAAVVVVAAAGSAADKDVDGLAAVELLDRALCQRPYSQQSGLRW